MSLQELVVSLMGDIKDPTVRMDIAGTIYYLRDVYLSGSVPAEEIKSALLEIADTILQMKKPWLTEKERQEEAKKLADQLFNAIKIETMRIRMMRALRRRMRRGPL